MKHGICLLTSIAVRLSGSHQSEMINQLLFGETFTVVDNKNGWLKITGTLDNYSGWIDKDTVTKISEHTFEKLLKHSVWTLNSKTINLTREDGTEMKILPGSTLPFFDPENRMMIIEDKNYVFNQRPETGVVNTTSEAIVKTALCFINAPYLWGGRSLFGIDCSGFTQVVYKISHVFLPRDAGQQVSAGQPIENVYDALPGDLGFFINSGGKVSHVGIIIGDSRIIHASGHVRIDKIDEKGIYNSEKKEYTHQLYCIRRLI